MCIAVSTTWRNTGITPSDIRRVFYRQPCLVCVLAKRNRDSKTTTTPTPTPTLAPATEAGPPIRVIDGILFFDEVSMLRLRLGADAPTPGIW